MFANVNPANLFLGSCGVCGGQAATGRSLPSINFLRGTNFVYRYIAIFLGTSVRPYGRTVSRTYVQKKRMSDKTKDSLLVISGNIRLKVHDFFFDGTFTLAPYCSYGPLRELGGATFRSNKVAQ